MKSNLTLRVRKDVVLDIENDTSNLCEEDTHITVKAKKRKPIRCPFCEYVIGSTDKSTKKEKCIFSI